MPDSTLPIAPADYWFGEKTLLTWPTVAVLNSRQGKYPVGSELWVRRTVDAVVEYARRDHVLLSSIGMHTWELATWAAGECLGSLVLLVPLEEGISVAHAHPQLQQIMSDFGLMQQNTLLIPWFVPRGTPVKQSWKARDRWILEQAKTLLPVSVRPEGSFATYLQQSNFTSKAKRDFSCEYQPRKHSFPKPAIHDQVQAKWGGKWDGWLVHWTRSTPDPWPGERAVDFYQDIVASDNHYPRDAEATLARILKEGKLRATRWRMPFAQPLISFTSLPPWEMVKRMHWRKRYVRPSYEPFGIAIREDALRQFGGRAVRYGEGQERATLSALERLFFQVKSEIDADWEGEQEWRLRGDLELPANAGDQICVVVPNQATAERIQPTTSFEVVTLV